MFELAAVRDGAPQRTVSRLDLRQVRQDALAEYMERKTGVKRGRGPRNGTRPRSAFFQNENGSHSGEGRLPVDGTSCFKALLLHPHKGR